MKSDWIKQSCSFNWSKETCVGRAGSPLASVGFCSEFWNVLPHSSSGLHLQLQLSQWAFAFHLTQEKRLKKRKRIYILCGKYYQGHTLWFREKKKKTKKKCKSGAFLLFSEESCIPLVSPCWHIMVIFLCIWSEGHWGQCRDSQYLQQTLQHTEQELLFCW